MRILILRAVAFLAFASSLNATSYAPDPKPQVSCEDAIKLASEFAAKNRPDIGDFYIDRIWCGVIPTEEKRCWIVSWASEKKGWYYVVVDMDRTTRVPPKGPIYLKHPFQLKQVPAAPNKEIKPADQGAAGDSDKPSN